MGGEDAGGDVVELLGGDRRAARGAPSPGWSRRPRGPRRAERPAHQDRRWTPCHPHRSDVFGNLHPAVARRRARAHDRFTGPRRQRCRPPRGLRGLRGRGRARRPRARGGRQGQEGVRGGARDRDRRALAGAHARVRRPSGRALAGAPVRAPARGQGRAGRGRAAPDRQARRQLRARADRPRRAAVALPQQARVLVRDGRRRRARVRLPRARPLERHPADDRLQARERALERAARAGPGLLPRARARRPGIARPTAASCATSSSARAAAPARPRCG